MTIRTLVTSDRLTLAARKYAYVESDRYRIAQTFGWIMVNLYISWCQGKTISKDARRRHNTNVCSSQEAFQNIPEMSLATSTSWMLLILYTSSQENAKLARREAILSIPIFISIDDRSVIRTEGLRVKDAVGRSSCWGDCWSTCPGMYSLGMYSLRCKSVGASCVLRIGCSCAHPVDTGESMRDHYQSHQVEDWIKLISQRAWEKWERFCFLHEVLFFWCWYCFFEEKRLMVTWSRGESYWLVSLYKSYLLYIIPVGSRRLNPSKAISTPISSEKDPANSVCYP